MAMGEVIERPNGKPYRSRRVIAYEAGEGVIVLGTHDLTRAQGLADELARYVAGSGFVAVDPWRGWWRDGFECGRRRWVRDPEAGRAGVWFREIAERTPAGLMPAEPVPAAFLHGGDHA